ncbi:phosphohistidine phosphatase SixA [Halotalea alkalilenta]|uniref:phosphohistidine phosphatase SixA n=1 Tax=Halotalea alkalilenta TaxID=376489 RepID=UPI0004894F47|nr:phosphohistidine phosphatase SixA [Halotalea alkalilenta]
MKLYVMRHGEALSGSPDPERRLSELGVREANASASWLVEVLGEAASRLEIVSSPYERAQRTAREVARGLGIERSLVLPLLTPDAPVEAVIEWLGEQPGEGDRLVVSHMPLVAELVGRLVDGNTRARRPMSTAEVVELEADVWAAGCATLGRYYLPSPLPSP